MLVGCSVGCLFLVALGKRYHELEQCTRFWHSMESYRENPALELSSVAKVSDDDKLDDLKSRTLEGQGNTFHTWLYSDVDFKTLDKRNLLIVNAFLLTQPPNATLMIWLSGRIRENLEDMSKASAALIAACDGDVRYLRVDFSTLIHDTPLSQHSYFSSISPEKRNNAGLALWSDIIRVVLLWKYGGTWLDLDSWPLKDFSPLVKSNLSFIPGFQGIPDGINSHVVHTPRPRSKVLERAMHILALCPYDDEAAWIARSRRNLTHWIYNDGIWPHVHDLSARSIFQEERLHIFPMEPFDPWWSNTEVNNETYVYHSRYPKKELTDTGARIVATLGEPLSVSNKDCLASQTSLHGLTLGFRR